MSNEPMRALSVDPSDLSMIGIWKCSVMWQDARPYNSQIDYFFAHVKEVREAQSF
jgi:hypothetical protein